MVRCANCQSSQIDGTIFCTECGASVVVPAKRQSTTLFSGRRGTVQHASPVEADEQAATPIETRLALQVLTNGRQMRLKAHEELLIGRRDEARGIVPDVDLSDDGGYEAGVSRRHAIICWLDGGYFVEDLSSANGTFVNDQRVEPQLRAALHNGDELRCGTLGMRVEISP